MAARWPMQGYKVFFKDQNINVNHHGPCHSESQWIHSQLWGFADQATASASCTHTCTLMAVAMVQYYQVSVFDRPVLPKCGTEGEWLVVSLEYCTVERWVVQYFWQVMLLACDCTLFTCSGWQAPMDISMLTLNSTYQAGRTAWNLDIPQLLVWHATVVHAVLRTGTCCLSHHHHVNGGRR